MNFILPTIICSNFQETDKGYFFILETSLEQITIESSAHTDRYFIHKYTINFVRTDTMQILLKKLDYYNIL